MSHRLTVIVAALFVPAIMSAQATRAQDALTGSWALGAGNVFSGFGAAGQLYLGGSQLAAIGGLGVFPSSAAEGTAAAGVAVALRAYSRNGPHRLFVEGGYEPLEIESSFSAFDSRSKLYYGPTASIGYSFLAPGGFTIDVSLGEGYSKSLDVGHWVTAFGVGFGYTLRRHVAR